MGDASFEERQRFELTDRYLYMASRLFEEKVERPRKVQVQKEDYAGYDYSAYKVLNILSLDDRRFLSCLIVWGILRLSI